ncbi:MAG: FAD-dependent oxidoreductase [bacterium]|nr:FAD-dependent oxidoreductase [bacterium]
MVNSLASNPWLSEPAETAPSLEGDLHADVAIIGAGYTGLSTALALREAGVDVVVLEQDYAGAGASGRNSGHLSTTVGNPAKVLVRSLGEAGARSLFRFSDEAVAYTERQMRTLGIDADYVANGNMKASVHPGHDRDLEAEAAARHALGARVAFLSSAELRERGIPAAFRCGLLHEPGGVLDPGKYLRGLYDAALGASVRVFERTCVSRIEDGAPVRIETERGSVTADALVLATNAFTSSLGRLGRKLVPLRVCCVETEPLSPDERSAIGWKEQEGISTTHMIPESYRWTPRGGIAVGTRVVRYAWNSTLSTSNDAAQFAVLERALRARFPMLASTRIAARWGGWVAFTTDTLPLLGTSGPHGNVFHAIGYSGHGIAQGTFLGAMLAARVRGARDDLTAPFERKVWSWPVEPFRWIGATAILAAVGRLDARTDRKVAEFGNADESNQLPNLEA